MRLLVGLTVLLIFYLGLKVAFPVEGQPCYIALKFVRYGLVGVWTTLGAPWVFLRLGLA